jgi:hypothetical protein
MQLAYLENEKCGEEVAKFISNLFRNALNSSKLDSAIIFGRINTLIPDVNKLSEHTIFDCDGLDECFGFTETELESRLEEEKKELKKIKEWYGGYHFGKKIVFNPFSITNYIGTKEFKSFMTEKIQCNMVSKSVKEATNICMHIRDDFKKLINKPEEKIPKLVLRYPILSFPNDTAQNYAKKSFSLHSPPSGLEKNFWSILLLYGFLTTSQSYSVPWKGAPADNHQSTMDLQVPNKDLFFFYKAWLEQWKIEELDDEKSKDSKQEDTVSKALGGGS